MYYILDKSHEVVGCDDIDVWGSFMKDIDSRTVGLVTINDVRISTVFLGIDHSFDGGRPVLFETMIFGGDNDQYQERYSFWDDALKGHERAINLVLEETER